MTLEELDKIAKERYYDLDYPNALRCYAEAFINFPKLALAYNNYGNILREMGYPEQGYGFMQTAVDLEPDHKDYAFNLAIAHLLANDLPNAWDMFETRWKFKGHEHVLDDYKQPRWEGQDLTGKRLLVLCEEGDGDNLQFARFTKHLESLGATVIHQTEINLVELFTSSFKNAIVVSNKDPIPEHDFWTPILSIPRVIRMTYDNMPKCEKYLKPSKKLINFWKKTLGESNKIRIGFCWSGRTKQYPFEELVKVIENNPQFEWINLQAGMSQEEADKLIELNVDSYFQHINDWSDTAGLVSNLDAVVAIDTGLAHLTGGLGVPCFILTDRYKTCWRWLLDRNDSPWYKSVTLVRQREVRGFTEQLNELNTLLQNLQPKK